jgi:hypothetical protein
MAALSSGSDWWCRGGVPADFQSACKTENQLKRRTPLIIQYTTTDTDAWSIT